MAKSSIDVFIKLHGQRKFSKELAASGVELEAMGVRGARSIASFAATGEKMKKFGSSWTRNVTLPVTVGAVLAGKAAVDWESAFTGVRKTVNATESQYASMERGIRSMSRHIPVAATELAGIAEAAGQLGIERKAILSFTRTIADLGVSTNLAGEEGATTLARFANITQMPQSQFRRLGSTIVALGNAGASTESDIAAMGLRIAAAGNFVGMTEPQILGIANALSSVGIEAEAGGTSASLAIKIINSAVAGGGKKLGRFAEIAGMGAQEFAAAWAKDPAAGLTTWIEGLARLKDEGKDVPSILNSLDPKLRGTRIQDTLLRAAGAGALFKESLTLGSQAWRENNALSREAGKRYETVASKLQILKNKVFDAGVSLGQELLPPLIQFVEFAGPAVGQIAHDFGALPGPIQASVLGLLVLTGPVASGLGYYARGVGKALVLTRRLTLASQGLAAASSIFTSGLSAGRGLKRSAAMAFEGTGAAGALQTAKGFAYGLSPAIAAYGIGNIVTSATNKDWGDAGLEAGGAYIGGLVGYVAGGGIGAMIGIGVGSLAGELASSLIGSDKKIETAQQKFEKQAKKTTDALDAQKRAGRLLANSGSGLVAAHHRQKAASQEVRSAEHALDLIRAEKGPNSEAAIRAEVHLAKAGERRLGVTRKLHNMEHLKGENLQLFKESNAYAILQQRKRLSELKERVAESQSRRKMFKAQGVTGKRLAKADETLIDRRKALWGAKSDLVKSYQEANKVAGSSWADFVRHANTKALELGHGLQSARKKVEGLEKALGRLRDAEASSLAPFQKGVLERGAKRALGNARSEERQLGGPHPHANVGPKRPGHRKGQGRNTRLAPLPVPPRASRRRGDDLRNLIHLDATIENKIELDGKRVAENTTAHSKRAANRE